MPRYFFFLESSEGFTEDNEGENLADDAAAHEAALVTARELGDWQPSYPDFLSSPILRFTTPPFWPSWSWRCRQLPADYHAIAFATAFLAGNPISKPRSFAGLARDRNFVVHCSLAHKPRQAHC
jgi:hypothetical protein